jgi:hypothetical protein
MKKIALYLLYTLLFFAALLFFTPKENVYYFAEEQLKPLGVIISHEETIDHGFTLEVRQAHLYVQKIKSADIGAFTVQLLGVYNHIGASKVILDPTFEQFFPPVIERLDLRQSLIGPFHINATAIGDFGEAEATVNLLERSASVVLKPSTLMRKRYQNTLKALTRTKEGDYRYEYKF